MMLLKEILLHESVVKLYGACIKILAAAEILGDYHHPNVHACTGIRLCSGGVIYQATLSVCGMVSTNVLQLFSGVPPLDRPLRSGWATMVAN